MLSVFNVVSVQCFQCSMFSVFNVVSVQCLEVVSDGNESLAMGQARRCDMMASIKSSL